VTMAREIVEALAPVPSASNAAVPARPIVVLGCPVADRSEEVALVMFRQLVNPAVATVEIMPAGLLSSEIADQVERDRPRLICVASLPPGGLAHTRYLLKKMRACCPDSKILVGRWDGADDSEDQRRLLVEAGADGIGRTLTETRDQLLALMPVLTAGESTSPAASGLHATVA